MSRRFRRSDGELLEAVRDGNTAAYGVLYQRHAVAARSLAQQLVQGPEEVEEILVETFARVLDLIRCGGGPRCAFRPYLLVAVRRYAAGGEVDLTDPDHIPVDPELAGLERSPIARAYLELPEQWRMVLWHAEVEAARPRQIASFLGLSAKETAALVEQARKGLRQAYLKLHEEAGPGERCRPILPKIVQYAEGELPRRETGEVDEHVAECIDCRSVFLELADVSQGLRAIVGPLVAGPAVDDYLADLARAGEEASAKSRGVPVLSRLPTPYRAALAGAAAATAALGFFLLSAAPTGDVPLAEKEPVLLPEDALPRSASGATPSGVPGSGRTSAADPSRSPAAPSRGSRREPDSSPPLALRGGDRGSASVTREPVRQRAPRSTGTNLTNPMEPKSQAGRRGSTLLATIEPLGALVRARPGIVAVRLRKTGGAGQPGQAPVTVTLRLPRGVMLMASGTEDGWSCRTAGQRVRCTRPGLARAESSTLFLRVNVAADAPAGGRFEASVRSGRQETVARSATGVRDSGAAVRFAAQGRLLTRTIGNALRGTAPGCETGDRGKTAAGKRAEASGPASGASGAVAPVDRDGDPVTRTSSCARLDLPAGSRVLWAGLYWFTSGQDTTRAEGAALAKVRSPRARDYQTVRATEIARRHTGHQAFADVTSLVRSAGSGPWWVADASIGAAEPSGWRLVVVAADGRQPYGTAVVLDPASDGGGGPLRIPFDGLG